MDITKIINNYTEGKFTSEFWGEPFNHYVIYDNNWRTAPDEGYKCLKDEDINNIQKIFKKGGDYVKYIRTKIFGYCV